MFFKIFYNEISKNNYENYKRILLKIEDIQKIDAFKSWKKMVQELHPVDEKEIDFYFKKIYFENLKLDSQKKKFISLNCGILNILKFQFYYVIYFILIKFKKNIKDEKVNGFILIDNIENPSDLKFYEEIIEICKDKKIIVNKTSNFASKNKEFISLFIKRYSGYNTTNFSFIKFFKFLILNLKYSLQLRINLFYLFLKIIDDCFYFEMMSKRIHTKFILDFRHYASNNIKRFFFNKQKTKICLIQKNISQLSQTFLHYSADILFCFGDDTKISNEKTFSNIDKSISVGSFFMNSNFYKLNRNIEFNNYKKEYDIIYIGGNDICPNGKWDTYKEYSNIYVEHLNWLKNISKLYPDLRIIIKNHPNNKDTFEKKFFEKTNIKFIDQKLNTYELAFKSKLILSWGSTMIIEFKSVTNQSYFLNPNMKNVQFVGDISNKSNICISKFDELIKTVNNIDDFSYDEKNKFCLNSKNVSNNIVKYLINEKH